MENLNRDLVKLIEGVMGALNDITDLHLTGELMVVDPDTTATLGYITLLGAEEVTFSQKATS